MKKKRLDRFHCSDSIRSCLPISSSMRKTWTFSPDGTDALGRSGSNWAFGLLSVSFVARLSLLRPFAYERWFYAVLQAVQLWLGLLTFLFSGGAVFSLDYFRSLHGWQGRTLTSI